MLSNKLSHKLTNKRITNSPKNIPTEIAQSAVEWLIEWQMADDPEQVWQQLCHWRKTDKVHEQAWQKIENVNGKLSLLAQTSTANVAYQTITSEHISRRQALKVISAFMLVSGSSYLVMQQQPWQRWSTDHYTGVGQQLKLQLEDGSELYLNSSTAVDIEFTVSERRIVLKKGEIYVNTGNDNLAQRKFNKVRPFIVELAQGQARPIGTRFSARQFDHHSKVAVYQGKVQLQANNHPHSIMVNVAQQRTFTTDNYGVSQSVSEAEAAWTQGIIVATDMSLADFLQELSRHRQGIIQCAPAVENLKVSGTYPLNKADEVIQSLTAALPIKIRSFSRYWLRVLPLNDKG